MGCRTSKKPPRGRNVEAVEASETELRLLRLLTVLMGRGIDQFSFNRGFEVGASRTEAVVVEDEGVFMEERRRGGALGGGGGGTLGAGEGDAVGLDVLEKALARERKLRLEVDEGGGTEERGTSVTLEEARCGGRDDTGDLGTVGETGCLVDMAEDGREAEVEVVGDRGSLPLLRDRMDDLDLVDGDGLGARFDPGPARGREEAERESMLPKDNGRFSALAAACVLPVMGG